MHSRLGLSLVAAVVAIAGLVTAAPAANATPDTIVMACRNGTDPSGLPGPTTGRSITARSGAYFELRHSGVCVWGRISRARKYDSVWVDRAHSVAEANAGHYDRQLGFSIVGSGTGTYTPAYDQDTVARACGQASGQFICTSWW